MADVTIKLTGKEYSTLTNELRKHQEALRVEVPREPGREKREAVNRLTLFSDVCEKVYA